MSPEIKHTSEGLPSLHNVALLVGASVLSTAALITYTLVKDSGATVADLGRDVYRGIKPHTKEVSGKIVGTVQDLTSLAVEMCKDEIQMFDRCVVQPLRGKK